MPDDAALIPASAVADELLRLATKVLATLDQDEAAFEAEQTAKRDALSQLVARDRAAVTHATERLNDLYRAARAIADNKGRRDVLEGILRQNVALDPDRTFDELDDELRRELKLARGITGAMRVSDIGRLLNQAAVQVDHLEDRANELEGRLRDASGADDEDSPARRTFAEALGNLRRDLDAFDAALPLPARPWNDPAWSDWTPRQDASPVLRFGRFTDPRLGESAVPALTDVTADAGFVIEPARRREQAVDAMRALVLRSMAAFPPGRVRVVLVDPRGLGESVAPFLHLAGHEGGAIGPVLSREHEIDAQLELLLGADGAGRDGVDCHLLCVFDHPIGLSSRAIGLVRALTEAGPDRGVFTVVLKDTRTGSHPREGRVLPGLRTIRATKHGFEMEAADSRRPVDLDAAPPAELIERVGAGSIATLTPGPEPREPTELEPSPLDLRDEATWWEGDASDALPVTFGAVDDGNPTATPAGVDLDTATSTVLVRGTSDARLTAAVHNALIGLTTRYAPSEVQLHLVGLRGTRDFESYGQRRLPHARLVGVESDAELAVAALEGARAEIARRLVLFQAAGVIRDGYPAYRRETRHTLPRVVVIIDDAGALFTHGDSVTQQISELLGEIALDGASTGVHLLVIDRDRPGGAPLEQQLPTTGLVTVALEDDQGIEPLGEAERAGTLRALQLRADREGGVRPLTFVDGSTRASLERAPFDLLAPANGGGPPTARLWFGEPVGLGSPVEVNLSPVDGSNVAIVAEDPVLGEGMVASAMTSIALACAPSLHVHVHVVDLTPLEGGFAGVAAALGDVDGIDVVISRRRTLSAAVDRVRNQLVNRLARTPSDAPPWLFVVNGITRGPERRADPSLGDLLRHLPQIVHDGPKVGIHTLLWGTDASLVDVIGTEAWRAFGIRVVGPMDRASALDLVDSPMASTLSPNQAALYDETDIRAVKFRPYGLASPAALTSLLEARRRPTPHALDH
jgi:hypothetical protein